MQVKEISVRELKEKLDNKDDFQLIDVREPNEKEICSIGGELIPLGSLQDHTGKVAVNRPVIVYCKSGGRSERAVQFLQEKLGLDSIYNLKGGILAWAREIDPSMKTY